MIFWAKYECSLSIGLNFRWRILLYQKQNMLLNPCTLYPICVHFHDSFHIDFLKRPFSLFHFINIDGINYSILSHFTKKKVLYFRENREIEYKNKLIIKKCHVKRRNAHEMSRKGKGLRRELKFWIIKLTIYVGQLSKSINFAIENLLRKWKSSS